MSGGSLSALPHLPLPAISRAGIATVPGQCPLKSEKFVRRQDALRELSVQFARHAAVADTGLHICGARSAVLLNDTQANE
ncbi:protein of unknown function [Burkholderia multivorans]